MKALRLLNLGLCAAALVLPLILFACVPAEEPKKEPDKAQPTKKDDKEKKPKCPCEEVK